MRWWAFLILAYVAASVQLGLGGLLGWGPATPDLLLLVVVFVALHANDEHALAAGVVAGLFHDVIADHGLGAHALAYGLAAAGTRRLRGVMYREHPLTHLTVTALTGVGVVLLLWARELVRGLFPWSADDPRLVRPLPMLVGVVATTALAPPVIYALRSIRKAFAFRAASVG